MAKNLASQEFSSSTAGDGYGSLFDEQRWLHSVQNSFNKDTVDDLRFVAKVFDVPKILRALKPEAYVPQLFAFGPYHQHRPEFRDMERYKLSAARRAEKLFRDGAKTIDLNEDTLAWMMAIDACFLLEFLQNYHHVEEEGKALVNTAVNWVNTIVRDIMMLENQIPLILLTKTLELIKCSSDDASNELSLVFDRFVKEVSPFKITGNIVVDTAKHGHLLELLYYTLVPTSEASLDQIEMDVSNGLYENLAEEFEDTEKVKKAFEEVTNLNIGPIRFLKENLVKKPMNFLASVPGMLMRKIPLLSALVPLVEKIISQTNVESKLADGTLVSNIIRSPLVDEIMIPSVSELVGAGVKFVPAQENGMNGINFDAITGVFTLPVVTLDANSEVILRNLVAYEASAVLKGPLFLARYTELMNGIIDTTEDVQVLRQSEIIRNHLKSDKQVADLWNGMSRSIRLTSVPKLDHVIKEVNMHHSRKMKVKVDKFLKKYVFKSWKILTLLAAIILLGITALQAFCSVYTCNRWFKAIEPPPSGQQ
uniref:Uncharacterized protein n=1 Tax=Ananas comosus var. bracteatus TaxID=296719 RepID=A0A6V7Q8H4_ANACO|nr:unnamed protein product [Ananas comosus var. bracteatus]